MLHNPLLADERGTNDAQWLGYMQTSRDGIVPGVPTTMQHRFSPATTCSQSTSDDEEVHDDTCRIVTTLVGIMTVIHWLDHRSCSMRRSITEREHYRQRWPKRKRTQKLVLSPMVNVLLLDAATFHLQDPTCRGRQGWHPPGACCRSRGHLLLIQRVDGPH